MNEFFFSIVYKLGILQVVADILLRKPQHVKLYLSYSNTRLDAWWSRLAAP